MTKLLLLTATLVSLAACGGDAVEVEPYCSELGCDQSSTSCGDVGCACDDVRCDPTPACSELACELVTCDPGVASCFCDDAATQETDHRACHL